MTGLSSSGVCAGAGEGGSVTSAPPPPVVRTARAAGEKCAISVYLQDHISLLHFYDSTKNIGTFDPKYGQGPLREKYETRLATQMSNKARSARPPPSLLPPCPRVRCVYLRGVPAWAKTVGGGGTRNPSVARSVGRVRMAWYVIVVTGDVLSCVRRATSSSGRTPSHHITSHHIASHHITSHYTTLHHITLHYTMLYSTLPYSALYYTTLC